MKRFAQHIQLNESKKLTVSSLKEIINTQKVFILFGGTMGAGKTYWAKKNLEGLISILDPDEIAVDLAGTSVPDEVLKFSSKALHTKNAKAKEYIKRGESFVDMGTMANAQSSINKIKQAKQQGFTTIVIFISTDPETAIARNRERIAQGGRGVLPDKEGKIIAQYHNAVDSFRQVKRSADLDYVMEIKS